MASIVTVGNTVEKMYRQLTEEGTDIRRLEARTESGALVVGYVIHGQNLTRFDVRRDK